MRTVLIMFVVILLTGCAKGAGESTLEFALPLDAFGDKTIKSEYTIEVLSGKESRIDFEGSESFSFHSGFLVRVSYQGSATGSSDADGQWAGQGDVRLTIRVTDPVQHETVTEKLHGITVSGDLQAGLLKGLLQFE